MNKLLLYLIFSSTVVYAQQAENCSFKPNKASEKSFKRGVSALENKKRLEAIDAFRETIQNDPKHLGAHFNLGKIYHRNGDLKSAKNHIRLLVTECPTYEHHEIYRLGTIYYELNEFDSASIFLKKYLDEPEKVKTGALFKKASIMLEDAVFYASIYGNPVPFNPKPLTNICTDQDEYLAIITPDGEYAYFTRRAEVFKKGMLTSKLQERFVLSKKNGTSFEEGIELPEPFNKGENEGGPALTIDNNELFLTICKLGFLKGQTVNDCDIYYSQFKDKKWGELKNMGKGINAVGYWDSQPTISADGKILYFASNREHDSYGGYDIFYSERNKDGNWEPAKNIGPTINTAGNEKSPFIHTDSKTLYFASDGHKGLGGYDLFLSKGNGQGSWQKPKNLGYPINTNQNDISFFVSTDGKTAYFASDRLQSGKGGWDIYSFDLYEGARPEKVLFLKGELKDEKGNVIIDAKVQLKNTKTQEVKEASVNKETGKYVLVVDNNEEDDFMLTVKNKGKAFSSALIETKNPKFSEPTKIDFEVKDIKVGGIYKINDIYFDNNSYELTVKSKIIIDEFVHFLRLNPHMKIELQGHTDNVGNDDDNRILSHLRAKTVYDYISSLGNMPAKIKYKGYGEKRPVDTNDTEDGRAKNRRTEFVILSK